MEDGRSCCCLAIHCIALILIRSLKQSDRNGGKSSLSSATLHYILSNKAHLRILSRTPKHLTTKIDTQRFLQNPSKDHLLIITHKRTHTHFKSLQTNTEPVRYCTAKVQTDTRALPSPFGYQFASLLGVNLCYLSKQKTETPEPNVGGNTSVCTATKKRPTRY